MQACTVPGANSNRLSSPVNLRNSAQRNRYHALFAGPGLSRTAVVPGVLAGMAATVGAGLFTTLLLPPSPFFQNLYFLITNSFTQQFL